MKLKTSQLRQIIKEEIQKNLNKTKIVPGGVYINSKGHEIAIEFIDEPTVAWSLLKNGKKTSVEDGTVTQLATVLKSNGFELDHKSW